LRRSPHHHDPGDPAAGADLRQHDIAGDPAHHVGDVKQRRRQAKHGGGQTEIFAHRQPGEADINAVQKRENKQHEQEGDQAAEQLLITRFSTSTTLFSLCCRVEVVMMRSTLSVQ
jgi:hypothetical protein